MIKHHALALEARRWVGITEQGKDNSGQLVEMFQRIIGVAQNESWCMSFVQYCLHWVDMYFSEYPHHKIHKDENCLEVWLQTPLECKIRDPIPGSIVVWNYTGTTKGHTGIVIDVSLSHIRTVEGNTSNAEVLDREGDGVFEKIRIKSDVGKMKILGYLNPWP